MITESSAPEIECPPRFLRFLGETLRAGATA